MAQRISQFFEQFVKGIYFPELRFTGHSGNPDHYISDLSDYGMDQEYQGVDADAWYSGTRGIHTGGSHFTDAYDPVAGKRSGSSYGCGGSGRFSARTPAGSGEAGRKTDADIHASI